MTREFQIVYRHCQPGMLGDHPVGDPVIMKAEAQGADQLEAIFKAGGFHVMGVVELRAVVDWSKPFFDRDEVAAYLGKAPNTISQNKGDGKFPWCNHGNGGVFRAELETFLKNHGNDASKKIQEQLKEAA